MRARAHKHTRKDYEGAELEFLEAIRINPQYAYAHYNLACIYSMTGAAAPALKSLEKAVATGPRTQTRTPHAQMKSFEQAIVTGACVRARAG